MVKQIENFIISNQKMISIAGFLRLKEKVKNFAKPSFYSDKDLFVLMKGGRPIDYFNLLKPLSESIVQSNKKIILFGSFSQQMFLKNLLIKNDLDYLHFLLYQSIRHLIFREINTLPKFIEYSIKPIYIEDDSILTKIKEAYSNRAEIIHPSISRYFYYYDILNEVVPLFLNYKNNTIPYGILSSELFHKLRFVTRYVSLELLTHSPVSSVDVSSKSIQEFLKNNGYGELADLNEDIDNLEYTEAIKLNPEMLEGILFKIYAFFDKIEELIDYGKK